MAGMVVVRGSALTGPAPGQDFCVMDAANVLCALRAGWNKKGQAIVVLGRKGEVPVGAWLGAPACLCGRSFVRMHLLMGSAWDQTR